MFWIQILRAKILRIRIQIKGLNPDLDPELKCYGFGSRFRTKMSQIQIQIQRAKMLLILIQIWRAKMLRTRIQIRRAKMLLILIQICRAKMSRIRIQIQKAKKVADPNSKNCLQVHNKLKEKTLLHPIFQENVELFLSFLVKPSIPRPRKEDLAEFNSQQLRKE